MRHVSYSMTLCVPRFIYFPLLPLLIEPIRFYRVDESRSPATGGSGLGLSIVKTLVEGMKGNVTVQSKLDEGSIFTISFFAKLRALSISECSVDLRPFNRIAVPRIALFLGFPVSSLSES